VINLEAKKIRILDFIGKGKKHLISLYIKEIMIGKKKIVKNCLLI